MSVPCAQTETDVSRVRCALSTHTALDPHSISGHLAGSPDGGKSRPQLQYQGRVGGGLSRSPALPASGLHGPGHEVLGPQGEFHGVSSMTVPKPPSLFWEHT